jgi:hypothetical protein
VPADSDVALLHIENVELEPGLRRTIRIASPDGTFVGFSSWTLADSGGGTAVTYRALEDDGWIVGRGRAGTFVTDTLPERPAARDDALARAATAYLRRAEQLGFDRAAAARALRSA